MLLVGHASSAPAGDHIIQYKMLHMGQPNHLGTAVNHSSQIRMWTQVDHKLELCCLSGPLPTTAMQCVCNAGCLQFQQAVYVAI
jgi:hypothetical protein